jgi:magnesium chelatase family protein
LDRIDIHIEVPSVEWRDLTSKESSEPSEEIRQRVNNARSIQLSRLEKYGIFSNSQMKSSLIRKFCVLDKTSLDFLEKVVERLGMSARAYHRVLKIARTIADLSVSQDIRPEHVSEAVQYRSIDRRCD